MGISYSKEHFNIAPAPRNFRSLDYTRYGRGFVTFTPQNDIICHSLEMASRDIPGIAETKTVLAVFKHNPDTFVAFAREHVVCRNQAPVGMLAHLPLTQEGVLALFTGELNTAEPALKFICKPHQRPAALYFWFIHIPAELGHGGGMSLVMERMTSDKNRDLPIFCKAANAKAKALFESMGFSQGATYEMMHSRELMSCAVPDPAANRKPYDNFLPGRHAGTRRTSVSVVHSLDDLLKCIAIRGAAYVEERSIPYAEDVDGNDFTATHLLGFVGDEPAGCIRIRYFADFIKLERLAVLPRCRGGLALDLIRAAIAFGKAKGYRRFYGQAAAPVLKLWEHFGFERRSGPGLSYLTDEVYYEIDLVTETPTEQLSHLSGANVLIRPEGQWDRPGPLEAAAAKSAVVDDVALAVAGSTEFVPAPQMRTMQPDRDIPGCVNPFYGESPDCSENSWPPLIYGDIRR